MFVVDLIKSKNRRLANSFKAALRNQL
jgi:hypothetical protein